ncbi:spexin-like [Micropterus dolomieu]|uniref:spexin-like n=1 Tax=Micropterus dolomieu TaxID=147949 RepID=UPI001E8EC4C7|nr:spexin-like [Micropterus dolomieu]
MYSTLPLSMKGAELIDGSVHSLSQPPPFHQNGVTYGCCPTGGAQRVPRHRGYKYMESEQLPRSIYPLIVSVGHQAQKISDTMKGLRTITLSYVLTLLLLASFIAQSWSAPKGSFQRRNWTPQAMLYLKGTQGRRFISEDRKEGDVYDTLHLETRSQNTEKLSVDQAATVLLNFLQQTREGADENPNDVYFQELPVWKREYF